MNILLTKIPLFPIWPKQADLNGVKIPLRASPLDFQMRRHLMRGGYEVAEREAVSVFIRPGDQILELGASVGIITCFLAHSAGQQGRVVCVEPNALLRPHFNRQLKLNEVTAELIHALCCPIWKRPIPASLVTQTYLASQNPLSGRLTKRGERGISVGWMTAEDVCHETKLEPTAIVIDIEGTEAIWTEYPPNFPDSVHTIILEVHPHVIGAEKAGSVLQTVLNEGFRIVSAQRTVFTFRKA